MNGGRRNIALHASQLSTSIGILNLIDYFDCFLSFGLPRRGESNSIPTRTIKIVHLPKYSRRRLSYTEKQRSGSVFRIISPHFGVNFGQLFSHACASTIKNGNSSRRWANVQDNRLFASASRVRETSSDEREQNTKNTHNFINFVASAAAAAEPDVILTFPVTHFADRRLSLPKLHRPTVMTVQWATE